MEKMNMSAQMIRNRIKSLSKREVITGFNIRVDHTKLKLHPFHTFMNLTNMTKEKGENNTQVTKIERLWEVYAPEWLDQVSLPEWPNETVPTGKKRWEATLVGGPDMRSPINGAAMLDTATHATHAQTDY
jgi:DNA-binding Lrp family transcriptional regulator